MYLLEPQNAQALYDSLHRTRCLVLEVQGHRAHARLRPEVPRPTVRQLVTLTRLCSHKARTRRIPPGRLPSNWSAGFEEWCTRVQCEGESDPRCLPLHAFSADPGLQEGLGQATGRQEFAKRYGPASRRTDDRGRAWKSPRRAHHGREVLQVSGFQLATGFHWDVEGTSPKRPWMLRTTAEVWRTRGPGHLNVYPNAVVRAGGKGSRRVFPPKK